MARFAAARRTRVAVQELEVLVRTALFKSATALVGELLQKAANRIDAQDQPKPGQTRKGREPIEVQGISARSNSSGITTITGQKHGPLYERRRFGSGRELYIGIGARDLFGKR